MTTTINAVTSTGLTTSADGSGIIKVQSNGKATNALAWVKWDISTGSVVIHSQYNVSSVTNVTTGVYLVTFATPMADANYAMVGTTANNNTTMGAYPLSPDTTYTNMGFTTTAVRVCTGLGGSFWNLWQCSVVIFGN